MRGNEWKNDESVELCRINVRQTAKAIQPAADIAILMRLSPPSTVSASLTTYGSSEDRSAAHSQNEAMSAARSMESFDANRSDSMIATMAAAARRRLISGVGGGICFGMPAL